METLGLEKEVRYPLTVNAIRTNPRSTEQEAHDDALTRGQEDAATSCELLRFSANVLSAAAEPRHWKCTDDRQGFACGFDGEIVCRVRERISSDQERCHDEAKPGREPPE
jgi:hypothetical protein